MGAIKPGQILHYTTGGFISCHAREKLGNVLQREGVPSWLQLTASRPQAIAQGTQKNGKGQDTETKAVISSLHSKHHQIAWVAMSGTS